MSLERIPRTNCIFRSLVSRTGVWCRQSSRWVPALTDSHSVHSTLQYVTLFLASGAFVNSRTWSPYFLRPANGMGIPPRDTYGRRLVGAQSASEKELPKSRPMHETLAAGGNLGSCLPWHMRQMHSQVKIPLMEIVPPYASNSSRVPFCSFREKEGAFKNSPDHASLGRFALLYKGYPPT